MFDLYRKGDYIIHARHAYPGEKIYNYLEGSEYVTSEDKPIVLCGTVDEQWVVDADVLACTYTFADGTPIVPSDLYGILAPSDDEWVEIRPIQDADAPCVWAEQTDPGEQVEVETSWGEVLVANRPGIPHGAGDWIVCARQADGEPDPSDQWIVNGAVFETTYVPA